MKNLMYGELVDNLGLVDASTTSPIRRSALAFIQLDTKLAIFETGIKVVDQPSVR